LRFNNKNKSIFKKSFGINDKTNILEFGCGTGVLCNTLAKWYPNYCITGIDRDTNFIKYAKEHYENSNIKFMEMDITKNRIKNNSFDVIVSHTVSEHIDPKIFFNEQYKILKNNGICLVLSSRPKYGIFINNGPLNEMSKFENKMENKFKKYIEKINKQYPVCQYPLSESEYPKVMMEYNFKNISTEYITINLTPDNYNISRKMALEIFNDQYRSRLETINFICNTIPNYKDLISENEIIRWKNEIDEKYKKRLELYNKNIKIWDTSVSMIMVIRGVKQD
jgi:ubiquinone/menaquinone biosynthesis C-methylase UbiE